MNACNNHRSLIIINYFINSNIAVFFEYINLFQFLSHTAIKVRSGCESYEL